MDIGKRIKESRVRKNLTQRDLAKKINVSPQVVSNWERDYTAPDFSDIAKMANVFETTTDYLINGLPDNLTPFSIDEAMRLLAYLKPKYPVSYIGTYIAIYSGMRRGEIAGLQWSDVDFSAGSLTVARSRQRMKGKDIVGRPKTEQSNRTIYVSADVIRTLKNWRTHHREASIMRGESWTEEMYILRHLDGSMYDPNTLTHDLRKAEIALELPHVSFHDLRHTHATMLFESGAALKTVSERLGHSSIKTTADIYTQVTENVHREAVDKLDSLMKKGSSK